MKIQTSRTIFWLLFFKTFGNSANIDIKFSPLYLLTELHFLCFGLLLLFMDLCYNFHHLLVVCFGLFVGLFLTISTDFAGIFGCGCKWYVGLCWIWLLGQGRRHSSHSYYWIDVGSAPIDLPKLLTVPVCTGFSAVATDAVVVYTAICFRTVVPLALSLGLCNLWGLAHHLRVCGQSSPTQLFPWSWGLLKHLHFLAHLSWAGALVYCPGVCWCWLQSEVAGGWLAGLVVSLPGTSTPNTEETGSLKQPKHIKLDCCSCKQLFKDSSLTFNDPQCQHTLISL